MMRLTYLVISNIGPFRGTHTIDLTTEKEVNGYAFFAINGRGKTSIYNAMRWCLFGEVKTRVKTSGGKQIRPRVRPIVGDAEDILMNRAAYEEDDPPQMEVILLAEGDRGAIQVTRTARSRVQMPRKDDQLDVTTTVRVGEETSSGRGAQEVIETFFPKALQQFFFIDGEALEEYTEMLESDNVGGLKEDVEAVLRLPALLRGRDDLEDIRKNTLGAIKDSSKRDKAAMEARTKAETFRLSLLKAQKEVRNLESRIDTCNSNLMEVITEIGGHAEMAVHVQIMQETMIKLESSRDTLERSAEERVKQAREAWRVLIWMKAEPLYDDYNGQINAANQADWEIMSTEKRIRVREEELKKLDGICSHCGQKVPDIQAHADRIRDELERDREHLQKIKDGDFLPAEELQIRLGRLAALKPQSGDLERVLDAQKRWVDDLSRTKTLEEEYQKLSEKVTEETAGELSELGEKKGKFEQLTRDLNRRLTEARAKADEQELYFRKHDREAGGSSRATTERQMDDIIGKLIVTIQDTLTEYKKAARKEVEKAASKVFMEVTNAPEAFDGIKLDDSFRARIQLKSGKAAVAPSSGMKSMMTISIIDGLRRVSGLDAPIFFDTPGRSLDEEHKQAMLNYFWRKHSQQFLIFAHSGEYQIEPTLENFGSRIAKAWQLTWPGDHRTCLECDSENVIHSKSEKRNNCLDCEHSWDTSSEHTLIRELEVPQ